MRPDVTLITDGDSLTAGDPTNPAGRWPDIALSLLGEPVRLINIAAHGDTLDNRARCFAQTVGGRLTAPVGGIVLHIAAGSNDLAGTMDGADRLFAHLQIYCDQARAAGLDIVVATIPPRIQFVMEPERELARMQFNDRLRRDWPRHAAALADWADDAVVGAADFPLNTALCPDGIHPAPAALRRLAQISAGAIAGVLAQG